MPALSGDARLLAAEGRTPHFSPDGTRIAYWVGQTSGGTRAPGSRVFVMPANGGEPTELARGFGERPHTDWAPDLEPAVLRHEVGARQQCELGLVVGGVEWWRARGHRRGAGADVPRIHTLGLSRSGRPAGRVDGDGVLFSAPLNQSVSLWRVDVSPAMGTQRTLPAIDERSEQRRGSLYDSERSHRVSKRRSRSRVSSPSRSTRMPADRLRPSSASSPNTIPWCAQRQSEQRRADAGVSENA